MAYTRGDNYIWSGDRTHFWIADGEDHWQQTGWGEGRERADGASRGPSGVGVPRDVADEFAVMRFAELLADGSLQEVADRAVSRHAGNGGCATLEALRQTILAKLRDVPPQR